MPRPVARHAPPGPQRLRAQRQAGLRAGRGRHRQHVGASARGGELLGHFEGTLAVGDRAQDGGPLADHVGAMAGSAQLPG